MTINVNLRAHIGIIGGLACCAAFDLNQDQLIDQLDLDRWVAINQTFYGDANLDGEFNTTDIVDIFVAGQYEDEFEGNSTWATGDWNGDGEFTSFDFSGIDHLYYGLNPAFPTQLRLDNPTGGPPVFVPGKKFSFRKNRAIRSD